MRIFYKILNIFKSFRPSIRSFEEENENLRADKEHLHREIKNLRNDLDELVYEDNQRNEAYEELREQNTEICARNEELASQMEEISRENEEMSEKFENWRLKEEGYKHKIKCIETHSTGCDESVQRMQIKIERLLEREKSLEEEILGHVKRESESEQQNALMSHTMETLRRNNETCNQQRDLLQVEIKTLQIQIQDLEEQSNDRRTESVLRSQIEQLHAQFEESEAKRFEMQNELFTLKEHLTVAARESSSSNINRKHTTLEASQNGLMNNKSSRSVISTEYNATSLIMQQKRFNSTPINGHSGALNWREEQAITTTTCDGDEDILNGDLYKVYKDDGISSTNTTRRSGGNSEALIEDLVDQRNR